MCFVQRALEPPSGCSSDCCVAVEPSSAPPFTSLSQLSIMTAWRDAPLVWKLYLYKYLCIVCVCVVFAHLPTSPWNPLCSFDVNTCLRVLWVSTVRCRKAAESIPLVHSKASSDGCCHCCGQKSSSVFEAELQTLWFTFAKTFNCVGESHAFCTTGPLTMRPWLWLWTNNSPVICATRAMIAARADFLTLCSCDGDDGGRRQHPPRGPLHIGAVYVSILSPSLAVSLCLLSKCFCHALVGDQYQQHIILASLRISILW